MIAPRDVDRDRRSPSRASRRSLVPPARILLAGLLQKHRHMTLSAGDAQGAPPQVPEVG